MNDNPKKALIQESARKIFYEQGYEKTHLEHIAKDCNISKQLLIYYFPNKAALADSVLDCYATELKELVAQRMHHYFGGLNDLQVCTAVELKLIYLHMLKDKKVQQFQIETNRVLGTTPWKEEDFTFYEMHLSRYNLNIDLKRDELRMLSSVFNGGIMSLMTNYCYGIIHCSENELLDYIIEILYRLMKIDQHRIDEINKLSNAIMEILNFKFLPNFVIE